MTLRVLDQLPPGAARGDHRLAFTSAQHHVLGGLDVGSRGQSGHTGDVARTAVFSHELIECERSLAKQ